MLRINLNAVFKKRPKKRSTVGQIFFAFAIMGAVIVLSSSIGMAETLILKPSGLKRHLPERVLGIQGVTAFYEKIIDDPEKLGPVRNLAPALLRFPGGTVANYYNWRKGQLEIPVFSDSSRYTQIMSRIARGIRYLHPGGVSMDDFNEFSRKVGAEIVLVPNLETSSLADQIAWFKHMKSKGIVPRHIELGNEFWVAMVGDPNVIRKFPDASTAMKIMEKFVKAIRPYLPDDALIAAQGAGTEFGTDQDGAGGNFLMKRMRKWDEEMTSQPWFDALTVHLYPEADLILGPGASRDWPDNAEKLFPAMMARADQGTQRVLDSMVKRFPGKEIWVTEWNPNGVRFFFQKQDVGFSGLAIHTTARMLLSFLRSPAFTVSTYHMLGYKGDPYSVFAPDEEGGFIPSGPAVVLRWFNEAANGGVTYQRLEVEGAVRIQGQGLMPDESYLDVEAASFTRGKKTTIIIHNAGNIGKKCDLSKLANGKLPSRIETFTTPDLTRDFSKGVPKTKLIIAGEKISLPAYSLTRLVWE